MTLDLVKPLTHRPLAVATAGLVKRFGRQTALAGLDLTVPEGAVYVLVGPNGAGKTTTLRVLLDLVRADRGRTEVFGRSTVTDGPAVRAGIGYVPEAHDFGYRDLEVARLLAHHARYFAAWDEAYAAELVRRLDVPLEARFGALSKGQARRVQLVQALAHRPPLLLLDEPTDGLDPLARDQALGLLVDHLAATPTTILLSTHLVHEVEGLGDCLGVIRHGRLVAQLERAEMERKLHRVRAEVPDGWRAGAELADLLLHRQEGGRELDWTVWGEAEEVRQRLQAAGATVRQMSNLNLEDATRVLLRMEAP